MSSADAVIPFVDDSTNKEGNAGPKDTGLNGSDILNKNEPHNNNLETSTEEEVTVTQVTADVHSPNHETTSPVHTDSEPNKQSDTTRDTDSATCGITTEPTVSKHTNLSINSSDISIKPTVKTDDRLNDHTNTTKHSESDVDGITIKPTLNVSELIQKPSTNDIVRAAGRGPDMNASEAMSAGIDDIDGVTAPTEDKTRKSATVDKIEEEPAAITIRPKKTGEKVLIPARKRRKDPKRRLTDLIQWVTCTRGENEYYDETRVDNRHSRRHAAEPAHKSRHSSRHSTASDTQPKIVKVDNILDGFLHYNYHTQEPGRPHGRGLCVIFTLFTGELKGYYADRARAFKFFNDKLDYDVYCDGTFVNCTSAQLKSCITQIQKVIAKKARVYGRPYYDRFVFIILTHGERGGLMTCADHTGILEEKRQVLKDGIWQSERVLLKIEDIVDYFKHDKVPELKDKPKMFLIQACRGDDVLKYAGGSHATIKLPQYDLSNLSLRPEVPIDADLLVSYATTPEHECWVSTEHGSWFIQKSIEVFERHYKLRHVEEMMTLINFVISEERGLTLQSDGSTSDVVQMPCKFSTLRMTFYL